MKIKMIRDIEGVRGLTAEWNLLLRRSWGCNVFLTHEWLVTWLKVYGDGKEPYVLFVEEDGVLVGIAPLYLTEHGMKYGPRLKQLCFLGDSEVGSDFLDFIIVKGKEDQVLSAILDYQLENETWDRICLGDIRADSKTTSFLKKLVETRPLHAEVRARRFNRYAMLLNIGWDIMAYK